MEKHSHTAPFVALRPGAGWLGCAGAVALLAVDGCVTPRALVQPPSSPVVPLHVERLHVEPPPTVLHMDPESAKKAPPPPISPFLDSPVSFLIRGHFVRGEQVVVRVCLRPDHSIASSEVIESSGDWQFDQMALTWAQRVRQRESVPEGPPVAPCGAVRVELHDAAQPSVIGDHADQLGQAEPDGVGPSDMALG